MSTIEARFERTAIFSAVRVKADKAASPATFRKAVLRPAFGQKFSVCTTPFKMFRVVEFSFICLLRDSSICDR